jgi:hypothetical protein
MSRRKKLTYLAQSEIERFMKAATELHRACCDPLISPQCDHSRALTELNAAIVTAIEAVTGDKAPWMRPRRSTGIRGTSRLRASLQNG